MVTMKSSKFSWSVGAFVINYILNCGLFFFLVLESTIRPVNLNMLFLAAALISLCVAIGCFFVQRWVQATAVVLSVLGVFAAGSVFMYCVDQGLERAESYAEIWAKEIEAVHRSTGRWPVTLKEIPFERRPRIDPNTMWPYEYFEDDCVHLVGGFVIDYRADHQVPELIVGRRDLSVTWNWKNSQWEVDAGQ
jgi:hypothetical protein